MREIDQVRITLLRMFRGAVQLPQEIIDEMLKAFLHTRNAAIKVRTITKGYLVRRFPHDYMDDAAAKAFNYYLGRRDGMNWVGLYPSMQHRNMTTCRRPVCGTETLSAGCSVVVASMVRTATLEFSSN